MTKGVDTKGDSWSWGQEAEVSDWNCSVNLPPGYFRSPDYTIVNSNGIAAQPNPKVYGFGGEINTPPTFTEDSQVDCLKVVNHMFPTATINHRSNLHIHIRVPGLQHSLPFLKKIQKYIHDQLPTVLNLIEPIPVGNTPAEKKREKRRKVSHHTLLTPHRLKYQLEAKTVKEFFEREVPATKAGKPMWHAQPRLAVGLRQLLQTDTIEFRHFPGTLDTVELKACINWCTQFLKAAMTGTLAIEVYDSLTYTQRLFPVFPAFKYEMEVGYQATAAHNGLWQKEIKANIDLILKGKFNASHPAYKAAAERACGARHITETS